MVREHSQPGHQGLSTLGALYGSNSYKQGGGSGGVDYEELLNQKRRDEARYRHGNDPYNDYARSGQLKSSTSDGFLNRVAPSYNSQGINQEMEDLSRALSRLQNSVAPENEDVQQSFSYPTSAINGSQDYGTRKTWSAPNKDPFGGGGLDDPFQRRSGYGGSHHNNSNIGVGGYQPSFGGDGRQRGRGRQNIDELAGQMKQSDRHQKNAYLHELAEQVEEQKRRRAKEQADASTDWWEKKKPPVEAEYKSPHPNQDHPSIYGNNASERKTRNKNNDPSSYDRPDPAETRRRYELELKEQMEAKKRFDDEAKRKEREEEEKLERRLQEQQEKMKREYEEEQNKKKQKEMAKLKRQEELAKRQVRLQQEMDRKKKEEDLRKQMERRGPSRHSNRGHRRDRGQDGDGAQPQQSPNFRTDSPPIPTLRGQPPPPPETETRVDETGTRPASPGVVDQLQNMRQSLERRRESLQYEDEKLGETWNGLAEL